MDRQKRLFLLSLIILVVGFFIDQSFVIKNYLAGRSIYFSIPLFILFFTRPSFSVNRFFNISVSTFIVVITILLILAGFANFNNYYGVIGSMLLGITVASRRIGWPSLLMSIKVFAAVTTIVILLFYIGGWDVTMIGRSSFLGQQVNIMGHLLNIGFVCLWFIKIKSKRSKKNTRLLNIALILYALPMMATISRTGVFCLLITSLVFLYYNFRRLFIILAVSASIIGPLVFGVFTQLDPVQRVLERTENVKEDPRVFLAQGAVSYILEHPFTGGGFHLYDNLDAYLDIGIYYKRNGIRKAYSIHNSFLDIAVFGGIPLALLYFFITLNLLIVGIKYYNQRDTRVRNIGAFLISSFVIVFIYSFTGQAFLQKFNWFHLGLCYGLIFLGQIYIREIKRAKLLKRIRS